MNGKLPADKLRRIHCGGLIGIVSGIGAAQDNVFLNVNNPFNAYRKIESQLSVFQKRVTLVEDKNNFSDGAIRVEFENEIWQLNPDVTCAAILGTSSHGFGLAVDIGNIGNKNVEAWLNQNAASFGFVKEYDFEAWHFTYIKSREGIPARVLEIESLPPEPTFTSVDIKIPPFSLNQKPSYLILGIIIVVFLSILREKKF